MSIRMALARGRVLDCSGPPLVMGVLNCTPDSFYPASRVAKIDDAVRTAEQMIAAGADILDIGGESTRPGSEPVATQDELERTEPVVKAIRAMSEIPISIDTQKAAVAQAALDAGADIINDVSALRADSQMLSLAIEREAVVVLMHMLGTPQTMQKSPAYDDAVHEILHFLTQRAQEVISSGVDRQRVIIDPGIGFGKRLEDNLRLLADLAAFGALGFPVLVGASRKSFIEKVLSARRGESGAAATGAATTGAASHGAANADAAASGAANQDPATKGGAPKRDVRPLPVEQRLAGSLAVHVLAALKGADILRVHDVAETADAVTMVQAVIDAGEREAREVGFSAAGE